MIIDYDFSGKRVTIVGGGHETARKVRMFVEAGAKVRLVGPKFDQEAVRTAKSLRVPIVRCSQSNVPRRAFTASDVVAVVADDRGLGRRLRSKASRRRILFYAGDDPDASDWVQPAVRFAGPITLAVSTGGGSPIVARTLADRLLSFVRDEDRGMVHVQADAREMARGTIPSAAGRRDILREIHRDSSVRAALRSGDLRKARALARAMVRRGADGPGP